MSVFFTGCTHFDHANIIRLANRPFTTVETMNSAMIERWNAKVPRSGTVYHLGDFGWSRDGVRLSEILSVLNGRHHLIFGNHDGDSVRHNPMWASAQPYAEVENCVLFHYPIEEWNGFYKGRLHLHCHTHSPDRAGNVHIPGRVNVTVEAWNYAPVHLDEVRAVWP